VYKLFTYRNFFKLKKQLKKSFPKVFLSIKLCKHIKNREYYLFLYKIEVSDDYKNNGLGTKVLNILCDFADDYNLKIYLTPSSSLGSELNRLIEFYKRFGFKFDIPDDMVRLPLG
jgi:GNAT superfamily N-acetyltransferase